MKIGYYFLKNNARRGFLALGSNGRTTLSPRKDKSWTIPVYLIKSYQLLRKCDSQR
jgi:hypothetical protein